MQINYQVKVGQGRAGQGRAGQGRGVQSRTGQGRAGQGRAWHGSAEQGRAWQGRAGQSLECGLQVLILARNAFHALGLFYYDVNAMKRSCRDFKERKKKCLEERDPARRRLSGRPALIPCSVFAS